MQENQEKIENSRIKKSWIYAGRAYILDTSDTKKKQTNCISDLDEYQVPAAE